MQYIAKNKKGERSEDSHCWM